jgi:hypothetical protein
MKRISVLATALLSVSLTQLGLAQSTPSTTTTKDQTKQDQKTAKTKAKTKDDSKADSGKKTTTSQDAAYAVAYRSGIPKQ